MYGTREQGNEALEHPNRSSRTWKWILASKGNEARDHRVASSRASKRRAELLSCGSRERHLSRGRLATNLSFRARDSAGAAPGKRNMVLAKAARLPVSMRAGASDNVAPGSARGNRRSGWFAAAKAVAITATIAPGSCGGRLRGRRFLNNEVPRAERGAMLFRAPSRATCRDRQPRSPRSCRCPRLRDPERAINPGSFLEGPPEPRHESLTNRAGQPARCCRRRGIPSLKPGTGGGMLSDVAAAASSFRRRSSPEPCDRRRSRREISSPRLQPGDLDVYPSMSPLQRAADVCRACSTARK